VEEKKRYVAINAAEGTKRSKRKRKSWFNL